MSVFNRLLSLRSRAQGEKTANLTIQNQMNLEQKKEKNTKRLLLLGPGAAGKSTLLKQMKYLYTHNRDVPVSVLRFYKKSVRANLVFILQTLAQQCNDLELKVEKENQNIVDELIELEGDWHSFNSSHFVLLKQLWDDKAIQKAYENRFEFTLLDNASYFLDNMDRIINESYVPTFEDVVHSRTKTVGFIEEEFMFTDHKNQPTRFVITDVGGQRCERNKWIHVFDPVVAIIFVLALSGYDQVLYEETNTNRLKEALNLFEDTFMRPVFSRKNVIIFLNKNDIFQKKIRQIPFNKSKLFPDFQGNEHDPDQVIQYIRTELGRRNTKKKRTLFFHVTQATDPEKLHIVFSSVNDILKRKELRYQGLL